MKITAIEAIPVKVDRKLAYGLAGRTALGVDPVSEHAIIRIDTDAGHGAGKPIHKLIDERADVLAFLELALR